MDNLSFTKQMMNEFASASYFRKEFQGNQALQILRYDTIYDFPSSITLKQLKSALEVLNCSINEKKLSEVSLKVIGYNDKIDDEMTLEQIMKKKPQDDVIIDFILSFDKILDLLEITKEANKSKIEFLPKKGILKYF